MVGEQVGEINLSESVFGVTPNESVMHSAVVCFLAGQRRGTKSTLTRAEVSGGGKKPWRQKGTGHARQGSTRAPQWRHGGVVFAPKPRDFSVSINKKVRRLAIKSAFSLKFSRNELIVLEDLRMNSVKTKHMSKILHSVGALGKSLVILPEVDEILIKSAMNLEGVITSQVQNLNVYNLIYSGVLVIPRAAITKIEGVYA
ncbi:MAG: 50S ribosomal protein L4 [Oscillospiraceae bacterium]|jgi:large subunit ribosomal protein L4|nr:50S ribosomal protein L4 [Oscillospiraceae bacterium]